MRIITVLYLFITVRSMSDLMFHAGLLLSCERNQQLPINHCKSVDRFHCRSVDRVNPTLCIYGVYKRWKWEPTLLWPHKGGFTRSTLLQWNRPTLLQWLLGSCWLRSHDINKPTWNIRSDMGRTVMKRYKTVIIRISRHILYCKVVFIRLSGPDYIYVDTKNRLFQRKTIFWLTLQSGTSDGRLVKN